MNTTECKNLDKRAIVNKRRTSGWTTKIKSGSRSEKKRSTRRGRERRNNREEERPSGLYHSKTIK